MNLTDDGITLIKSFEGLRLKAYQDVAGIWTIGYGHTKGVKKGQQISVEQAEKLLEQDIAEIAELPLRSFLDGRQLNDDQYSALVSLIYNCGQAPLHGTLGSYLLAKNYPEVSKQFLRWNHAAGRVVPGLTRRRMAEQRMFDRRQS